MLQYTQNEAAKTRETNHNIIWRANLISKISLSFSPSGAKEKERKRESGRVEEELWERGCWAIAHVQYRSRAVWEAGLGGRAKYTWTSSSYQLCINQFKASNPPPPLDTLREFEL